MQNRFWSSLVVALVLAVSPALGQAPVTGAPPMEPLATAPAQLGVAQLTLCAAVVERAPVDARRTFAVGESAWAFTEIVGGAEGQKIYHAWSHLSEDGKHEISRIELPVNHATWRTWSKMPLPFAGEWEVCVLDAS